jgi:hypothetical protein
MTFSTYLSPGVAIQGGSSSSGGTASAPLTGTGAIITTSQPLIDVSQTWSNGAVTFTGAKISVTDTASAAASLLLDTQVGGTSVFRIRKDGSLYLNATSSRLYQYNGAGRWTFTDGSNTNAIWMQVNDSPLALGLASNVRLTWSDSTDVASTADLILRRKGAANLQLGNADAAVPVLQTLSVQSIVGGVSTDASAAAYPFTITGAQGTGMGAGGSIVFKVAPAGSTGNAQNGLVAALTINSAKQVVFDDGTVSLPSIRGADDNSGIYFSGNNIRFAIDGSLKYLFSGGGETNLVSTASVRWADGGNLTGAYDLFLARDASNMLAQRNGAAAQALNIYNTFTSSTSFERYSVDWITTANLAIVGPNKGSVGGTQRVQRLSYLEDGGAGSTVPLLGSTCPAASGTVKSWIKIITSDGTTAYIPCWA